MLRHLTLLAVLATGCASAPPPPVPRPLPEVVLWSFIPAVAEDDAPCRLLRPDGRVIARAGCVGPYVEFEPREEDLAPLVTAFASPALEALGPEYSIAEGTGTTENTLQWVRAGCRRQVVVDGWLGNAEEGGNPEDRARTPHPFLTAHDALLSLRPRAGSRPHPPRRAFVLLLLDHRGFDASSGTLPPGWPAPERVSPESNAALVVTLPGSELQAARDWLVDQHARRRFVKLEGVYYSPARVSADVDGEPRRLEVPPLTATNPRAGLAPLVSGTCP
jgi:hypothetical protein